MLSPRVGGGADPGEFDVFTRARVKFPTPGYRFCAKQVFPTTGQNPNVKLPTLGKVRRFNFPWVARLPPPLLGLNIDSCITFNIVSFARKGKITLLEIHELYFSLSEPI